MAERISMQHAREIAMRIESNAEERRKAEYHRESHVAGDGFRIEPSKLKICVCGNIEGTAVDDCERCKLLSIIDEQREQIQKLQSLPIFDVLERLLNSGHEIKEQDGLWHLFASNGERVTSAMSVRLLCVNILWMEM